MGLLGNLLFVLAFSWVVRALLGTREITALALPFQVLAAMLTVVAIEVVMARPRRSGFRSTHPWRALRRRAGMLARSLRITRTHVRHGLAPALGLRRGEVPGRDPATDVAVVERLLNRAVLAGLALGLGLIAVLMLTAETGPVLAGTQLRRLESFGWLGLFGASVLLLRVLLEILRPAPNHRQPR